MKRREASDRDLAELATGEGKKRRGGIWPLGSSEAEGKWEVRHGKGFAFGSDDERYDLFDRGGRGEELNLVVTVL